MTAIDLANDAAPNEPEPMLARYDSPAEAPAVSPVDLVLRALRGRIRNGILVGLILAVIFAPIGYVATKPKYDAVGVIRVAQTAPRILYANEDSQNQPLFDTFVQSQADLVLTRPVLERAVADKAMRKAGWPEGSDGLIQLTQAATVTRASKSELIQIDVKDSNGATSATAVNAIIDAFQDLHGERAEQTVSIKERTLGERERQLSAKADDINAQLLQIGAEHGIDTLTKSHADKIAQLALLDQKISDLDNSIAQQEANSHDPSLDSSDAAISRLIILDHAMASMIDQKTKIAASLAALGENYGSQYPAVVKLREELKVQDQAIEARRVQLSTLGKTGVMPQNQTSTDNAPPDAAGNAPSTKTVAQLKDLRSRMSTLRQAAKTDAVDLHRKLVAMQTLQQELTRIQTTLDETRKGLEQVRLENQVSLPGRITVGVRASEPLQPSKNLKPVLAAAGGAGGFVLGFALVVGAGLAQRKYRFSDELQSLAAEHPMVGVIPHLPDHAADHHDLPAIHHTRNALQLQFLRSRSERPALAITGASADLGRTQFALALARSFADSGARTVILDADMANATLSADLGHSNTQGLREALQGTEVEPLLIPDSRPNLYILPIGQAVEMNGRHVSTRKLALVLESLFKSFDMVILDVGPIQHCVEAGIAVGLADQTIMVVPSGSSTGPIQATLTAIAKIAPRRINLLFNQARHDDPALRRHA